MAVLPCNCPDGFTPSPDGSECLKIITVPSVPPQGEALPVCAATPNIVYGILGARFYETSAGRPLPIIDATGPNRLKDNANNELLHPQPDVISPLWGNGSTTSGRLNNAGVWACNPPGSRHMEPLNQWIGFTICIDIPEAATYSIGIAGDNLVRFKLNCQTIVEFQTQQTFDFNYWHVIPLALIAGLNVIHLEGYNSASQAAFGAEIYSATTAQLAALTTEAQLTPFIVFSTKDQIGQDFQTGPTTGYTCPSGFCLDCNLDCVQIQRAECSVCFLLTDCTNSANIRVIDADPVFNLISLVGSVIKIGSLGNTCWSLAASQTCTDSIYIAATDTVTPFATCELCAPPVCYILTDCESILDPVVVQEDLSQYLGKVIVVSSYGTTCWTISLSPDCVGAVTFSQGTTVVEFNTCLECNPICYELTDCSATPRAPVIVTNDMSSYIGGGQIIKIDTFGAICWSVAVATSCQGSVTIAETAVITVFLDCCLCQALPCYQLTVCSGQVDSNSPIVTKTDLSAYVGKVINTVNTIPAPITPIDPITCWSVSLLGACPCPIVAPEVTFNTGSFVDCICCIPVPPPIPPPLPPRILPGPVKEFTKTDMSDCEIDTLTDFAETFWDLTKQLRFGITTCNWNKNYRKIWVKQQLIQLANSIDPLYCVVAPGYPCETCNPDPCNCNCTPCSCRVNVCSCSHQHDHRYNHSTPCNPCGVGSALRDPNLRPEIYLLWADDGPLIWEWPDSRILPETL